MVKICQDRAYVETYKDTREPIELLFDPRLASTVEQGATDSQYPVAQAAYRSGEILHFGRLDVYGVYDTIRKMVLPWNEVASIGIDGIGEVHIKQRNEEDWAVFPLGDLINPAVLRKLIEEDVSDSIDVRL